MSKYIIILLTLLGVQGWCQNNFSFDDRGNEMKPYTDKAIADSENDFQFIILSDRTGGHRMGVFANAIEKVNLLQPEFIMTVGDLIEGYSENTEEVKEQWNEFDSLVNKLDARFFYVPGNHDYTNKVMGDIWKKRFGADYYHFRYKNVLFLCLNSEDHYYQGYGKASLGQEQFKYFEKVLEDNKDVRWTFVFMHQPLWVYKNTGAWNDFQGLLHNRKHTVFAGHIHQYTHYERQENDYIILATTGGISDLKGKAYGEMDHLVKVSMRGDEPIIANIVLDGIDHARVVSEKSKAIFDQIAKKHPAYIQAMLKDSINKSDTLSFVVKNPFDFDMQIDATAFANTQIIPMKTLFHVNAKAQTTEVVQVPVMYLLADTNEPIEPLCFQVKGRFPEMGEEANSWEKKIYFKPTLNKYIQPKQQEFVFDGKIEDWQNLDYTFTKSDNSGLTYSFDLVEGDTALFAAVSVEDPTIFGKVGRGATESEGVMFAIDVNPFQESAYNAGDIPGFFKQKWHLLNFTPLEDNGDFSENNSSKHKISGKYSKTKKGYVAELCIPKEMLEQKQGKDWQTIRINVIVNDFDSFGVMKTTPWQPMWWGGENVFGSGTFRRKEIKTK